MLATNCRISGSNEIDKIITFGDKKRWGDIIGKASQCCQVLFSKKNTLLHIQRRNKYAKLGTIVAYEQICVSTCYFRRFYIYKILKNYWQYSTS